MAAPLGFKTFTTGEVLTAADTNGYLMQGVLVFANAAARTAAITSPQEGQTSYLKDTDVIQVYSGSAWVTKSGAGALIGCDLYKSATQSITTGTWTAVTFSSEIYDTDNLHDTSTNTSRITIPAGLTGKYLFTGSVVFAASATGVRGISLYKDGSPYKEILMDSASSSYSTIQSWSAISSLVAGSYYETFVYQESGGSINLNNGTSGTSFQIQYLGA